MGNLGTLTHDAAEAIKSAQIIFGADRLLKSVQEIGHSVMPASRL